MTEDSVRSQQQGSCTILTLNRPDKLNALDAEAHLLLWRRIDEAAADDDCRTIILTGAGRGFCAGQDLSSGSSIRPVRRTWAPASKNTTIRSFVGCASCRSRSSAR
jgi:enoyl-CoA hydratase/carnithine racemase